MHNSTSCLLQSFIRALKYEHDGYDGAVERFNPADLPSLADHFIRKVTKIMSLLSLFENYVRKKTNLGRHPRVPVVRFNMSGGLARQLSCARTYESFLRDQYGIKLTGETTGVNYIAHRYIFVVSSEHDDGVLTGALRGDSCATPLSSGLKEYHYTPRKWHTSVVWSSSALLEMTTYLQG